MVLTRSDFGFVGEGLAFVGEPFLNLFGKTDENAEREARYRTALAKYPADTKSDCLTLGAIVQNIEADISRTQEDRVSNVAAGGSGRIQDRELYGLGKRQQEVLSLYNNAQCTKKFEDAEAQAFQDAQLTQLEKVTTLTKNESKASSYILYGMIGLVVIVAGVLIYKSVKK